jgi:hypothetical protein
VRRQEALRALYHASFAGLVVAPAALLLFELAVDRVRLGETLGGAVFAVAFFASTSVAVAFGRGVMASYIVKSVVIVAIASVVSFDGIDKTVAAVSIAVSAISYLTVQTTYIVRRRGRLQRRIARGQKSVS